MGGFTSAITPLLSASKSLSPLISVASTTARLTSQNKAASDQNKLEEKQLQERIAIKQDERALKLQQDEQTRAQNLDRALGAQKVSFASRGLSLNDQGSVQSVLTGIIEQSEREAENRKQIESIKPKADELSMRQQRERNLLDYTIQARRNSISSLSGLLS